MDGQGVVLDDGSRLEADLVLWATGAEALPIFSDSGLRTDARGFLLVGDTLQSVADPALFAAGDCASMVEYPDLPKAGVYAVRQGPILWRNLRVVLTGRGFLRAYKPQKGFLSRSPRATGGRWRAITAWPRTGVGSGA